MKRDWRAGRYRTVAALTSAIGAVMLTAGGVAPGLSDHTPSSVAIVTAWAQRDLCATPALSGGTSAVQTMTWTGCAAGTQVVLDTVTGGDNGWFSPSLTGADASLDATQTVWTFFAPLATH